jgi:PAS domain S-box-containing protein
MATVLDPLVSLQDLLDRQPVWINTTAPLVAALQAIQASGAEGDIGYVLVGSPEQLLGVVTEKDLLRHLQQTQGNLEQPIAQLLTPQLPVFAAQQYTDPMQLLNWMDAQQISCSAVVDERGCCLGVVRRQQIQRVCLQMAQHHAQDLQGLLDNSPEIVERFDLNFRHVYVSAEISRITGMPTKAFLGKTCRELGLPEDMVNRWEAAANQVIATQGQQRIEFETPTTQGVRSFEMVLTPEKDQQGNLQFIHCVSRDNTDRKQVEREREEAINFRIGIEQSIPIGIAGADFGGRQTYINEILSEMLGWSAEELIGGTPPYVYWPPEEVQTITQACQEGLAQGRSPQGWELIFMRRNGERFPVRILDAPLRNGEGEVIGMLASVQDITAEKQTQALQNTIFQAIPDLLLRVDRQGKFLDVQGVERFSLNAPDATHAGRSILDYFPTSLAEYCLKAIKVALRTGEIQIYEHKLEIAGHPRDQEVRVAPLDEETVLIIVRDITERKQTVEALKASEDRFRLLTEHSTDLVMRHSLEGVHLYVSPVCQSLLGYHPQEMIGRPAYEFFHPEDIPAIYETHQALLEDAGPQRIRYRLQQKNGEYLWVETISTLVRDSQNGEPLEIQTSTRNITEQMRYEHALEEAIQLSRTILESITNAFFAVDPHWCITYCNDRFAQIIQKPQTQIIGQNLWSLQPDMYPTIFYQELQHIQLKGEAHIFEGYYEPTQSWYEVHAYPTEDGGVSAYFQDISDRKQAEQRLLTQLSQEQILNEITQGIRRSLDLPTVFATTTEAVGQLLGIGEVVIYQLLQDQGVWIARSSYSNDPSRSNLEKVEVPDSENWIAKQLRQGLTVCIEDTTDLQDPINRDLAQQFPGAWLITPIEVNQNPWGAFTLHHFHSQRNWSDQEIDLARAITDQLAIAIQQAQLFEQLEATNAEFRYQVEVRNAELVQSIDFEQLLRVITDEVRSSLDEKEILQAAVRELCGGLHLEVCLIGIFDHDQNQSSYTIEYKHSGSVPSLPNHLTYLDPQIIVQLQQRQTVFCSSHTSAQGWLTLVLCPIQDGDQLIGFLELVRAPRQAFLLQEIRLAEQVANQCSIGIRQARLFQATQDQVYQLTELNQLKEEFLHLVSHELRTPLTSMKMALTMLEITGLNARQTRYFHLLKQEWQKELELVNNLLDLQRLESGQRNMQLTPISLQEWIPSLLEPFHLRCQERQLQLMQAMPEKPLNLISDPGLLTRILSELLNNAVKYTPSGESIHLIIAEHAKQVTFQVINTGVEIPKDHLPRIFEKFHRVTTLDRYQQGGTGLGLPLVRKAVEVMGGEIQVQSEDLVTQFRVILPCHHSA